MSLITKVFAAVKKIHIEKSDVDKAASLVEKVKAIVALIEKDLADGKLDMGEIVGLVMAVLDLANIVRSHADKA